MRYCDDVDLLHWEPAVFRDGSAAGQLLVAAAAAVEGTLVTLGGTETTAAVRPGHVVVLDGTSVAGSFPVVAVTGPQALTISVLYDGLYPPDGQAPVPHRAGVVSATGQTLSVVTFNAQQRIASDLVLRSLGLEPADVETGKVAVLNPQALRRPAVLGGLQMVYAALAAVAEAPELPQVRADLYERLFRRSLQGLRVEIDTDGDGAADAVRVGGYVTLTRG